MQAMQSAIPSSAKQRQGVALMGEHTICRADKWRHRKSDRLSQEEKNWGAFTSGHQREESNARLHRWTLSLLVLLLCESICAHCSKKIRQSSSSMLWNGGHSLRMNCLLSGGRSEVETERGVSPSVHRKNACVVQKVLALCVSCKDTRQSLFSAA
ncbi:hypothetical protein TGMAS_414480 [Toxoplasma gondii MAS]|uniref:Uncharacterized protein n=1 Tax=Toxoplasma gondii MAS TaxID=943118 RepID=A0A086QND0_TOXGO|nr:hypothetical protein TGMAS_414480 [Toxoplasma gondii MAS]